MTEDFVSAAELMGRVLGADGYPFVVVPHPISSAGHDALAEAGKRAADEAAALLTAAGSAQGT